MNNISFSKLNIYNILKAFNENQNLIKNYLSGQTIEGYNDDDDNNKNETAILGMSIGIFALIFIIILAFYIWAIVILIKFGSTMPVWAVIVSIICLLWGPFGGIIIAIIIVYSTKGTKVTKGVKGG
jgi:uncharacterized membrane protein